jgi:hypothetical protein
MKILLITSCLLLSQIAMAEETGSGDAGLSGGHVLNALEPGSTLDDFKDQRVSTENNTSETLFEDSGSDFQGKIVSKQLRWNR